MAGTPPCERHPIGVIVRLADRDGDQRQRQGGLHGGPEGCKPGGWRTNQPGGLGLNRMINQIIAATARIMTIVVPMVALSAGAPRW
jgi:hypothetical protein